MGRRTDDCDGNTALALVHDRAVIMSDTSTSTRISLYVASTKAQQHYQPKFDEMPSIKFVRYCETGRMPRRTDGRTHERTDGQTHIMIVIVNC